MKRRDFVRGMAALSSLSALPLAAEERWPAKPVRMIVPFPAGGATDIIARILAERLGVELGQSFVVENRGGASGMIGQTAAAKATPDGYTVLLTGNGPHAVNTSLFDPMPYDPLKDFAQISLTSILPLILNVHPSVPVNSVAEFVQWVRDNPGTLNYASPGVGSPPNLTMESFKKLNDLSIVHIPYKGSSLAQADLIGGQVSVMFDNALASYQHIKSGSIKALAVGSAERLPSLPDVPTFIEAGFPGFEAYTWTALVAPAGVPESIIKRLNEATVRALESPDVKERLAGQGAIAASSSPEELADKVRDEIAKWGEVIKSAGIPRVSL